MIPSSAQPDLKLLDRLHTAQRACFAVVGLIAAAVLCGWLVPAIGSALPGGWSLMKANTALALLLTTASLMLTQPKRNVRRLVMGRICAVIVLFLASVKLFEHLSGRSTGLDTLLAADSGAAMPGRMAAQTALFLVLLGLTLAFEGTWEKARRHVVDALTIAMVLVTLVITTGYSFGAAKLLSNSANIRPAPHALVCMVLLSCAVVVRRTQLGFFSVLVGVGIGSYTARKSLAYALLMPFLVIRGASYLTETGWIPAPYARALAASTIASLALCFVMLMAWTINNLERGLRDALLTDELTGIHNRRGFYLLGEYTVREARRTHTPLTVLYFDLDGLKKVNDTLGHDVGSQLLIDFANLLRANFRGSDVLARVGGDEFAVVLWGRHTELVSPLQRLDSAIAAANSTGGKPYRISYSVGETTGEPTGRESFSDLVGRADALMYQRKRLKKEGRRDSGQEPRLRLVLPSDPEVAAPVGLAAR